MQCSTTACYNTVVGFNVNNISSNVCNTFVGANINGNFGNNSTVLGSNVSAFSGCNSQVVLADGTGNVRLYSDTSGNTAIGATSADGNKLLVNGGLKACGSVLATGQGVAGYFSQGLVPSPTLLVDWSCGNIQQVDLTGTYTTVDFVNGITGGVYNLLMSYTGSTTIAFGSNFSAPLGASGAAITGTTGARDVGSFIAGGTGYFMAINKDFRQL
jgi:hypothetical protein